MIRGFPLGTIVAVAIFPVVLTGCCCLISPFPCDYGVKYQVKVNRSVYESGVLEPVQSSSDNYVNVEWHIRSTGLRGIYSNPMNIEGKMLWKGAVFSYRGESEPLILAANLTDLQAFLTPDLPQPPTIIPPHGQVQVYTLPLSRAKWRWFHNKSTGGFYESISPLIGPDLMLEQNKKGQQQLAEMTIGQEFDVRIPIQFEEKVLIHEFHFRIVGAKAIGIYY